jgi:Protein of unknown function (DUF992)
VSKKFIKLAIPALVASLLLAGTPGANAQTKIKSGTLTCTGGAGIGLILGSKKTYKCNFVKAGSGGTESYAATITKLGLDVGVTGESVLVWTVLTSTEDFVPRALAGNFAGASADASLGLGAGAKVLVGGTQNSVTLQPLSVQGQTGVNLAVGIAELTLR